MPLLCLLFGFREVGTSFSDIRAGVSVRPTTQALCGFIFPNAQPKKKEIVFCSASVPQGEGWRKNQAVVGWSRLPTQFQNNCSHSIAPWNACALYLKGYRGFESLPHGLYRKFLQPKILQIRPSVGNVPFDNTFAKTSNENHRFPPTG